MGRDGAEGLLDLRRVGWHTIAQNQASSAVYGMPKAAAELKAASEILPLEKIGSRLMAMLTINQVQMSDEPAFSCTPRSDRPGGPAGLSRHGSARGRSGHGVRSHPPRLGNQTDIDFHYCADPARSHIRRPTRFKPTVILQDLVMPGIDGLTLVSQFRANPATKDIPIIVLSTNENPQVKGQAFAVGRQRLSG